MKTTILLLAILLLISCNNRQVENEPAAQNIDSLQQESSVNKTDKIFNNSFRDINNFDFKVGNQFIDSLHSEYLKKGELYIDKDICGGDYCQSYQTFINKADNSILYFFKGDAGEYGFSNAQYLLHNDSLSFVRNFNVDIETWPTDTRKTVWKVEEITYKFDDKNVTGTKRTVLTKDLYEFDFTLEKIKSEIVVFTWKETFKEKTEELKQLLELKNSEDGD